MDHISAIWGFRVFGFSGKWNSGCVFRWKLVLIFRSVQNSERGKAAVGDDDDDRLAITLVTIWEIVDELAETTFERRLFNNVALSPGDGRPEGDDAGDSVGQRNARRSFQSLLRYFHLFSYSRKNGGTLVFHHVHCYHCLYPHHRHHDRHHHGERSSFTIDWMSSNSVKRSHRSMIPIIIIIIITIITPSSSLPMIM